MGLLINRNILCRMNAEAAVSRYFEKQSSRNLISMLVTYLKRTLHWTVKSRKTLHLRSCLAMFCKEGVKNFAKFTGKHLLWSLFKKRLKACNFNKKTPNQVFS